MPDDDDVHGSDIDGETPPVHESGHVYKSVIIILFINFTPKSYVNYVNDHAMDSVFSFSGIEGS
jgi:hypothetical protein